MRFTLLLVNVLAGRDGGLEAVGSAITSAFGSNMEADEAAEADDW
jgi:hypothetical protein